MAHIDQLKQSEEAVQVQLSGLNKYSTVTYMKHVDISYLLMDGTLQIENIEYEESIFSLINSVELITHYFHKPDLWWRNSTINGDYQQAFYFIVANFVSENTRSLQGLIDPIIDSIDSTIQNNFIWIYSFGAVQVVFITIEALLLFPSIWRMSRYLARIMNTFAKVKHSDLDHLIYRTNSFLDKCSEQNRENGILFVPDEQEEDNYLDSEEEAEIKAEIPRSSPKYRESNVFFVDENTPFNFKALESPNHFNFEADYGFKVAVNPNSKEIHVYEGAFSQKMADSSKNLSQQAQSKLDVLDTPKISRNMFSPKKASIFQIEAKKRSRLIKMKGKKGSGTEISKTSQITLPLKAKPVEAEVAETNSLVTMETHLGRVYSIKALKIILSSWIIVALCVGSLLFLDYRTYQTNSFYMSHIRSLEEVAKEIKDINAFTLRSFCLGSFKEDTTVQETLENKVDQLRSVLKQLAAIDHPSFIDSSMRDYLDKFQRSMEVTLCEDNLIDPSFYSTNAECFDDVDVNHGFLTSVVRFNEIVEQLAKQTGKSGSLSQAMVAANEQLAELGRFL